MVAKRGITVWISAFATFLAILSSFAMVILLINEGAGSIVKPYIIGSIAGNLSVESYLWISITTTFIFLGITCIIAYRKQPPKPEIVKMFLKVGGNLAALRKAQEASITEMADQMEYERKVNRKFFNKVNSNFEETNKETLALLAEQRKTIKKARLDMISTIEKRAGETGEKLSADLKKQGTVMIGVKRLSEEGATALKNQRAEQAAYSGAEADKFFRFVRAHFDDVAAKEIRAAVKEESTWYGTFQMSVVGAGKHKLTIGRALGINVPEGFSEDGYKFSSEPTYQVNGSNIYVGEYYVRG